MPMLLITSVLGRELQKRLCKGCTEVLSISSSCSENTNMYECFCTNDDFWSYSSECAKCQGFTDTYNQKSYICDIATDTYFLSLLQQSAAAHTGDSRSFSVPASTTDTSENSKTDALQTLSSDNSKSIRGVSSTSGSKSLRSDSNSQSSSDETMTSTGLGRASNSKPSSNSLGRASNSKPSSNSLGSESNSQSSSDESMTSNSLGSESKSQSSSGDGNTLFASKVSLGSLLAYVMLIL